MSERAAELASQFEQANRDFIEEVERLTDDQCQALVPGENWLVGVVAHHVVDSFGLITGWIENLARGEEAVYDHDAVDAHNAQHARECAANLVTYPLTHYRSVGGKRSLPASRRSFPRSSNSPTG
jgi:hypothetical protein